MTTVTSARPESMSDRRFITVLISALAAGLGAGLSVLAIIGLQDPVYTDFDTGTRTDSTGTLAALIALGAVLVLVGTSTVVALFRAQTAPLTMIPARTAASTPQRPVKHASPGGDA